MQTLKRLLREIPSLGRNSVIIDIDTQKPLTQHQIDNEIRYILSIKPETRKLADFKYTSQNVITTTTHYVATTSKVIPAEQWGYHPKRDRSVENKVIEDRKLAFIIFPDITQLRKQETDASPHLNMEGGIGRFTNCKNASKYKLVNELWIHSSNICMKFIEHQWVNRYIGIIRYVEEKYDMEVECFAFAYAMSHTHNCLINPSSINVCVQAKRCDVAIDCSDFFGVKQSDWAKAQIKQLKNEQIPVIKADYKDYCNWLPKFFRYETPKERSGKGTLPIWKFMYCKGVEIQNTLLDFYS